MSEVLILTESVIEAPQSPALSVQYAFDHIRGLSQDENHLIEAWIEAATQLVEARTDRDLIQRTREVWLDCFPNETNDVQAYVGMSGWYGGGGTYGTGTRVRIELPRPPLVDVLSIAYIDADGVLQTLTDGGSPEVRPFKVVAPQGPYAVRGWVEPTAGTTWPIARTNEGAAVRIQYRSGYGTNESDIPAALRSVLAFLVGHWDRERTPVSDSKKQIIELPYTVEALLKEFKETAGPAVPARATAGSW